MWAKNKQTGFTIVELLIVIVVIGILAAIVTVAYGGIQQRARDAQRRQDVATIVKALEMYYVANGSYPNFTNYTPGSSNPPLNTAWSTTADGSWSNLETVLNPYVSQLPRDPISTPGVDIRSVTTGYNYQYFGNQTGGYCGAGPGQAYILNYRLEGSPQEDTLIGNCTAPTLGPYGSSDYRVRK